MKSFKKYFFLWLGLVSVLLFLPKPAWAFCPLCVIATGLASGIFRWLGVDDTIVGLWIGGFTLSGGIFFNNFLTRKSKKIRFQFPLILAGFYLGVISFLNLTGGLTSYNNILGINKIVLGMVLGSLLLSLSPFLDRFLRDRNQGKIFISHQKVVVAIGLLLVVSLVFQFIIT